ncbi:MAG: rRNA maturation RNase YbeY [Clostridia bacterium]|nr:rRNA maturation RNase YbeY [Clostridia bacterium]
MTKIFFEYRTDPVPKLYETLMKRVIRAAVSEKYPKHRFEVNVTVVGDRAIRKLNREHRGIDKATDVLSFPMFEFGTPEVPTLLGDIVISRDTAYRQAKEYGHSPRREFCFLAAHSALHLLGYDHESETEREEMEAKQEEILNKLGITREQ